MTMSEELEKTLNENDFVTQKDLKISIWLPLIVVILSIISGAVTWYFTEKSKIENESFKQREERYIALIDSLRGFYVKTQNPEKKQEFLHQLDLCWLYCPDSVIRKAYLFLDTVNKAKTEYKKLNPDELERLQKKRVQEFVLELRKDLFRRTKEKSYLNSDEFQIIAPR